MCIAIVKPPKVTIPNTILTYCHENNKDGCGMSYIDSITGELITYKTMDFTKFMAEYKEAFRNNPNSTFLLHFRVATHGTVNEFNCHPFQINEHQVMMHNGTIHKCAPDKRDKDEDRNDTQIFNDSILSYLPNGWETSLGVQDLIEDYIGASKVITMNDKGEVNTFNKQLGNEYAGCWWSDYSYYKGVRSLIKVKPTHGIHDGPFVYTQQHKKKRNKHTTTPSTGGTTNGCWAGGMDLTLEHSMTQGGKIFKFHNNQKFILNRTTADSYLWKACSIHCEVLAGGATFFAKVSDDEVAKKLHPASFVDKKKEVNGVIRRRFFPCSLCKEAGISEKDINVVEMLDIEGDICHEFLCDSCLRDLQNVSAIGWRVVTGIEDMDELFTKANTHFGSPI